MRMSNKESEKLCEIINLAIEKNEGNNDNAAPYGLLANALRESELHFDYLNCYPRVYSNRSVIAYTFNVASEHVFQYLKDYRHYLIMLCEDCIDDAYELPRDEDGEPTVDIKKTREISKLPTPPKVTFEKCKDVIIRNIENAEHSILAAVAWFTNPEIMDALRRKADEGIVVAVIVDRGNESDTRNRDFIAKYTNMKFPVYYALNINWKFQNYMHHKFCIIDNKTVLHGTFNWTKKAEYNDEDVTEDSNEATVDVFLERFKYLRKKYNCFYRYPNT